jgi:DNA-directed RNA polymerase specialized sigma24 family protein
MDNLHFLVFPHFPQPLSGARPLDAHSQSPHDSVRMLLAQVKSGNTTDAVAGLWHRFYPRLVEFAQQRLHGNQFALQDADDLATNTFYAFYLGATVGAFKDLKTREDVWQIMQMIASRKAAELARNEHCRKRGGMRQRVSMPPIAFSGPSGVQLVTDEDQLEHLLALLPDEAHQHVALMKIGRFTEEQIAVHLDMPPCQVGRMLDLIRKSWAEELLRGEDGGVDS